MSSDIKHITNTHVNGYWMDPKTACRTNLTVSYIGGLLSGQIGFIVVPLCLLL